jgi:hypothetical protein
MITRFASLPCLACAALLPFPSPYLFRLHCPSGSLPASSPQRRDLAVLLLHSGDVGAARLELRTYLREVSEAGSPVATTAAVSSSSTVNSRATDLRVGPAHPRRGPDPFELLLCRRLLEALSGAGEAAAGEEGAEGAAGGSALGALREPEAPLGLEAALQAVPPWERAQPAGRQRYLPLTW